jgi:hypothetical protein
MKGIQLQRSHCCAIVRVRGSLVCGLRASKSGYNLARMPLVVVLAPEAVEDLRRLTAHVRAAVRTELETHLRHEPEKTSPRKRAVVASSGCEDCSVRNIGCA